MSRLKWLFDEMLLALAGPWLLIFCKPPGCHCIIAGAGLASLTCPVHRPNRGEGDA